MRFKRVYIEITNICNLSCDFCVPHKRENRIMTKEEFNHIIDEIRPFTDHIYLHVKGEPLLHPDFDELVKLAYNTGLKINLTTNATLLENHLSITKYLRQINVSLHATNNLEIIKTCKEISDCIINFRIWNFDENEEALKLIKEVFELDEINFKTLSKENNISNFTLAPNIFISTSSRFEWPDITKDNASHGYCHALKDQIAILVDGTVVPCCLDNNGDINLGNIFDASFDSIIESSKVNSIIEGFRNRIAIEELCKKCTYKNRF